jgi:SAM-dependent methyltransferase
MKDIYSNSDSDYLQLNKSWHAEDSAWKAMQIFKMIKRNELKPKSIVEVGCGVGEVLSEINDIIDDEDVIYHGYDIANDAIIRAMERKKSNLKYFCKDFVSENKIKYDLLLMIDVFDHVPNYIGFIEECSKKADYKIFHIPIDIHLSGILRNQLISTRISVGHLHYFTKETAVATLVDSGLVILDYFYTPVSGMSKKFRSKVANIPRNILFRFCPDLAVKIFGGYSLMVITR